MKKKGYLEREARKARAITLKQIAIDEIEQKDKMNKKQRKEK